MFDVLKVVVILMIGIPFAYIIFDVIFDLAKRVLEIFRPKTVPIHSKDKRS